MFWKRQRWLSIVFAISLGSYWSAVAQQAATPLPEYDAAVIKVNKTLSGDSGTDTDDATFQATNVSMKRLISRAFGIRESQIFGVPAWADSMRWDVNAKVTDPDMKVMKNLSREQRQKMLAALLVERFHLQTHIEVKTLPVYELVVAKSGSKLETSKPVPTDTGGGDMTTNDTDMKATKVPLSALAVGLSAKLDRTVIDKTGLTGRYDFHLQWTPDNVANNAANNGAADAPPTIFTAIEEQLGLKLQPAKGPAQTLVIDHVEQPTEN
jgi:uncharacterized protein (TIGR03435 family)